VAFKTGTATDQINAAISRIKKEIRRRFTRINYIITKPEEEGKTSDGISS
jgi:hypothetical protein